MVDLDGSSRGSKKLYWEYSLTGLLDECRRKQ